MLERQASFWLCVSLSIRKRGKSCVLIDGRRASRKFGLGSSGILNWTPPENESEDGRRQTKDERRKTKRLRDWRLSWLPGEDSKLQHFGIADARNLKRLDFAVPFRNVLPAVRLKAEGV
jgi:hypothetical protein